MFRILLVFVVLLSVPLNVEYYNAFFSIKFSELNFQDIFQLLHHRPGIVSFGRSGLISYAGWGLTLLAAILLALVWQKRDKGAATAASLYQFILDFVRFRLSIGVLFYGVLLLLSLYFPKPAISDLHSQYGQLAPWKIYFLSSAVASAGYIQTIGVFLILGALLVLWNRTVVAGVLILLFVLSNVVLANFAYSIGDHLQASYLFLLALVLLIPELPSLYSLLILRTKTYTEAIQKETNPVFDSIRKGGLLLYVLTALVFVTLAAFGTRSAEWPYDRYEHFSGIAGYYQVHSFKQGEQEFPVSLTDSIRWKDVVFEDGPQLSIRKNHPSHLYDINPAEVWDSGNPNVYLAAGNADRLFYSYTVDKDSIRLVDLVTKEPSYTFQLVQSDSAKILLNGFKQDGTPVTISLTKINKQYLLHKGRRKPIVIN
ncbi:hypothetical protein [Flavihumibacter sp. UBA7668]|uniref:hypothetical protein n=1 Tax=Flavihumibacter sp. UBA7668 TaxID=1946542 RepID=UPI0025C63388|nr:hypothetical protein [Flavihumibacter sp. UBA7668]